MHFKILFSVLFSVLFAVNAFAAEKISVNDQTLHLSLLNHAKELTLHETAAAESTLHLSRTVTLPNGKIKARFQQYYQGVPVWGVSVVADQLPSGQYNNISGTVLGKISADISSTTPSFNRTTALEKAKRAAVISENATIINEQATLYVMQHNSHKARLVYVTSFMIESDHPKRPYAILDAQTGEIIAQWDGLTYRDATGPGGNVKIGKYSYGKDYGPLLVDDLCRMDNPFISTYNLNHQISDGSIFQFQCPENTYQYINGAYSPLNDAHYLGKVVYDLYQAWLNESPLDFKLKMRVHYGNNYENAFWDGQQMTFGDGGNNFYPLVSADITGHEISHGFTEQNSNLVYQNQSGGINESFSDMAGEATKYFLHSRPCKTV